MIPFYATAVSRNEETMENENPIAQQPEDAAVEGAPVEGAPAEGAPAEGAPVEGVPVEKVLIGEKPVKKSNNILVIVLAFVLGLVLAFGLGLAVIAGTDGFDEIKAKISSIFGGASDPTEPEATDPQATEPEETVPLKSYTVDDATAAQITDKVIATAGNAKLTNGELQVYYTTNMINFYSNYGMYLMYMGVDFSKPLDQQVYDPQTNQTWQEFIMESALQNWQLFAAVEQYAAENAENGYQLGETGQEYIAGIPGKIQEMAEASDCESAEQFMKEQLGAMASVQGMSNYMKAEYFYMCYYSYLQEKYSPEMEKLEQYFADNEETFTSQGITKEAEDLVDVRHILIIPEGGTTGEDGKTKTYSEEEWEACRQKAQEILDQWKAGEATEDSFADLANEKSEDGGSNTNGGLYSNVKTGDMVTEFNNWIFDESRIAGDTDLVKTPYGYHIMYFVKREPTWVIYARNNYLNEIINEILTQAQQAYPMTTDYASIGLSN